MGKTKTAELINLLDLEILNKNKNKTGSGMRKSQNKTNEFKESISNTYKSNQINNSFNYRNYILLS